MQRERETDRQTDRQRLAFNENTSVLADNLIHSVIRSLHAEINPVDRVMTNRGPRLYRDTNSGGISLDAVTGKENSEPFGRKANEIVGRWGFTPRKSSKVSHGVLWGKKNRKSKCSNVPYLQYFGLRHATLKERSHKCVCVCVCVSVSVCMCVCVCVFSLSRKLCDPG